MGWGSGLSFHLQLHSGSLPKKQGNMQHDCNVHKYVRAPADGGGMGQESGLSSHLELDNGSLPKEQCNMQH